MPKVLIVEDNEAMAVALRDGFTYEGYDVLVAEDGSTGLKLASESSADLVILDVMLPRMSGLDVCRRVRRNGSKIPIIMLTARGQEIDKVLGLKCGADDYITKPFSFMELMARVEAVLRCCGAAPDTTAGPRRTASATSTLISRGWRRARVRRNSRCRTASSPCCGF